MFAGIAQSRAMSEVLTAEERLARKSSAYRARMGSPAVDVSPVHVSPAPPAEPTGLPSSPLTRRVVKTTTTVTSTVMLPMKPSEARSDSEDEKSGPQHEIKIKGVCCVLVDIGRVAGTAPVDVYALRS